jgi:hypothetical protein
MLQKLNEPVSVQLIYDHKKRSVFPRVIFWQGQNHLIKKLGFYYQKPIGKTLFHIFAVSTDTLSFKLVCNSSNLHWVLEEVSDGEIN